MINARAKTVATTPAFRRAFRERRCLVLADGFYEWQLQDGRKQPFYIRLCGGAPFAFAGLWDRRVPPDGQPIDSCTIITTVAKTRIQPLHSRMPVILPPKEYDAWLDPRGQDVEGLQALLHPYRTEEMETYPVSAGVNNSAHDSPACIAPLA